MNRRSLLKLLSGLAVLPVPGTAFSAVNRRVILVELSGANDGLNTVVPYKDDRYHELRPDIGLKGKDIISLDDTTAFHHALKPLMSLWERNEMAVVNGLGYPSPNRSHFKSIALWETGGDGNRVRRNGWITHDIEHAYANAGVDAHGISLGGGMGAFSSANGNWLSMRTANQFTDRKIDSPTTPKEQNNPMLNALVENASTLNASLERIATKVINNPYPSKLRGGSNLNKQLNHVVNLINSGVNTPVLKVRLPGFDTHKNQPGRHNDLLKQLASGIKQLRSELSKTDNWNNTLVLTYSEFGRRAAQNHNRGTDHGTASAHFLFGGGINGGHYGTLPDLGNLLNDDLQFTLDYRALYSTVLTDWLQLPTNAFNDYSSNTLSELIS